MSDPVLDAERFRSVVAALPDDNLAGVRREAARQFAVTGFPTAADEDWKYTSLADVAALSNEWLLAFDEAPSPARRTDSPEIRDITRAVDAHWIVLCDGFVSEPLPGIDGVSLSRIAGHLLPDGVNTDPMSLFNAALLQDGLHIAVARKSRIEKPIGIIYADNPSNAVTQTRVRIDIADNASLQLVEYMMSSNDGRQFTNSVTELSLSNASRLDHVRIQNRNRQHAGVAHVGVSVGRDAVYRQDSFDFGGSLSRTNLVTDIDGPGADVSLNGLYLASGSQHMDNHTSIVHGVGPARSREEYRGILSGRSRCVFNGKVVVATGADGTDSSQANHNLVLSDGAEIDTKPELEIYADDVKCAHGATVGQLDESALFYLRSRGLDRDAARRIITRAFAAGILTSLSVEGCREYLEGLVDRELESVVGDGHV